MIRVIDDQKVVAEAVERGLHEEETLSQLYELIRGLLNLDELYLIDSEEITQLIGERSTVLF